MYAEQIRGPSFEKGVRMVEAPTVCIVDEDVAARWQLDTLIRAAGWRETWRAEG